MHKHDVIANTSLHIKKSHKKLCIQHLPGTYDIIVVDSNTDLADRTTSSCNDKYENRFNMHFLHLSTNLFKINYTAKREIL